jgi:hypothetical protein
MSLIFKIGHSLEEWKVGGVDKQVVSNLPTLQLSKFITRFDRQKR